MTYEAGEADDRVEQLVRAHALSCQRVLGNQWLLTTDDSTGTWYERMRRVAGPESECAISEVDSLLKLELLQSGVDWDRTFAPMLA